MQDCNVPRLSARPRMCRQIQRISDRRDGMRCRVAVAVLGAVIASGVLSGCGGGMPRTSANVAICMTLARVLESKADIHLLAGLAFESKAPVSDRLRQDIASYVALAAHGDSRTRRAGVRAEINCASIDAPVAPGFG
jgi:hypothetical protein